MLAQRCGPNLFLTLHISVESPVWSQPYHTRSVAEVFYDQRLSVISGSFDDRPLELFDTGYNDSWRVKDVLCEAAELGIKAVSGAWSKPMLEQALQYWLQAYLDKKNVDTNSAFWQKRLGTLWVVDIFYPSQRWRAILLTNIET